MAGRDQVQRTLAASSLAAETMARRGPRARQFVGLLRHQLPTVLLRLPPYGLPVRAAVHQSVSISRMVSEATGPREPEVYCAF